MPYDQRIFTQKPFHRILMHIAMYHQQIYWLDGRKRQREQYTIFD
jgi:hypothetical protein